MHGQVKCAAVRTANAFNPSIRRMDLGVPTVTGIVRHLIVHVLAETQSFRIDPNSLEEQEDAAKEVSESLVVDHTT